MPQSKLEREIDRSDNPWRTNCMISLRTLSGWMKSGCDWYRFIRSSAKALIRKK